MHNKLKNITSFSNCSHASCMHYKIFSITQKNFEKERRARPSLTDVSGSAGQRRAQRGTSLCFLRQETSYTPPLTKILTSCDTLSAKPHRPWFGLNIFWGTHA